MCVRGALRFVLIGIAVAVCAPAKSFAEPGFALTGRVTSAQEGAMEGVLVSWPETSSSFASARSAFAGCSAPTSAPAGAASA